jgi:hypothetical protein
VATREQFTPIALVVGLVFMIAALLYAAFNRAHVVPPPPAPMHESR